MTRKNDTSHLPIAYHRNRAEAKLFFIGAIFITAVAAFLPSDLEDKNKEIATRFGMAAVGVIGGGALGVGRLNRARNILDDVEDRGPVL